MNDFHINVTCPDCKKKILVEGDLNFQLVPTTTNVPVKPKKPKNKIAKKTVTKATKKKTASKKKTSKKGLYDEDLQKLFKLKSGGTTEDIQLTLSEMGDPEAAMLKMEVAAKENRKNAKKQPNLEKEIQGWLSGGPNPFSE